MFDTLKELVRAERGRTVSAHLTGFHYLGVMMLVAFVCEATTGILLMIYYRPSAAAAYHSTAIITDEVRLGWLVRSLHRWGADALIFLASMHMIRVYFARAYRPPRSINWVVGVLMLVLLLALGFTGTLLPWDQYAYWYIDSARQTIAAVPVLGNLVLGLFWGGWDLGEEVLLRFYAFHVGVLPWLAFTLIGVHTLLVWRLGIQEPAPTRAPRPEVRTPFFPDFVATLFILTLLAGGVLFSAAVVFPPSLFQQADPLLPLAHTLPRWYLLPVRELLRALPGGLAASAVVVGAVLIFLVPVLDRYRGTSVPRLVVQRAIGVLAIAAWALLTAKGYWR